MSREPAHPQSSSPAPGPSEPRADTLAAAARPTGPRVLVVTNTLLAPQLPIWRAAQQQGADIHLLGSYEWGGRDHLPGTPSSPAWAPTWVDAPKRWRDDRGHLWWTYPRMGEVLRQVEPDVVHIVSEPWGLLVLQALRRGATVVAHGADNLYSHDGRLEATARLAVARWAFRRLAGFASWSQEGVRIAHEHGLPSRVPTCVVPAVVPDPDDFVIGEDDRRAVRHELGVPDDVLAIGFVGRLVEPKGVDVLIEAVARLRHDRHVLLVCGAGPRQHQYEAHARRAGVDARFLGAVDLADVARTMSAFDVLAVPSLPTPAFLEQFGRVAVEGMLARRALVVSDSGALPDVVGDAASVVPAGDARALAEAIDALLADESARLTLGRRARARALDQFSPEVLARRLTEHWSIVQGRA